MTLAAVELQIGNPPAPITDATPVPVRTPPSALQLDYGTRTDKQPIYLGKAAGDVGLTDDSWTVTRFTYESGAAGARLLRSEVREALAWTERATPTPNWEA